MHGEPVVSAKTDLGKDIEEGRAYVLLINGREHNVCVESIGSSYLFGNVAINKVLFLIDRKGAGKAEVKAVMPQDEKSAIGPKDELFHSVPIVTSSPMKIRVRLEAIDVIEDPWRTFIGNDALSPAGDLVDESKLLAYLPSLHEYRIHGGGFARNPDAWAKGDEQPGLELRLDAELDLRLAGGDSSSE